MVKAPLTVAGIVFLLVALLHLARIITHFDVSFAGKSVPLWVNSVGFAVAAVLSYWMFKTVKKITS